MKIVYFAALRREIGVGEESVTPPAAIATVAQLRDWLKHRSPAHARALAAPRLMAAVNQDYAGPDAKIGAGDEIAFFPPVTGG
jgi:molybdopterin synthase sulfur carrier subunit